MLAAWLHTLNPVILRLTETWAVRWYGLAYVTGFAAGWWLLRVMSARGMTPLSKLRLGDAVLAMVAGVMLGGRLGYVLFYQPSLLWTFSETPPWWGVLMIQKGGMASHGGMLGVITACWLVLRGVRQPDGTRAERVPFLHVTDLMAIACTPGLFLGRMANFVNGELLGKIVALPGEPAPWWAVKYPQEILIPAQDAGQFMSPEAAAARTAALQRLAASAQLPGDPPGRLYEHLIERVQRGSHDLAAGLEPLISARYPSQLLQGAVEGLALGLALWLIWCRARAPGVIGAWFLMLYGAGRIMTEFVRLPDADLGRQRYLGIELSRGQWLSVAMIVAGAGVLLYSVRRAGPKFGGWCGRRAGSLGTAEEARA